MSNTSDAARDAVILSETRNALAAHAGNRTQAARALGISRQAMSARLARHPALVEEFPGENGRPQKSDKGG